MSIVPLNGFNRRPLYYVLDENGDPKAEEDVRIWGPWLENNRARRQLMDHNFMSSGPPQLWETMVFGRLAGEMDGYQARYSSRLVAIKRHDEICGLVRLHMRGWRMWTSHTLLFFSKLFMAVKRWFVKTHGNGLSAAA